MGPEVYGKDQRAHRSGRGREVQDALERMVMAAYRQERQQQDLPHRVQGMAPKRLLDAAAGKGKPFAEADNLRPYGAQVAQCQEIQGLIQQASDRGQQAGRTLSDEAENADGLDPRPIRYGIADMVGCFQARPDTGFCYFASPAAKPRDPLCDLTPIERQTAHILPYKVPAGPVLPGQPAPASRQPAAAPDDLLFGKWLQSCNNLYSIILKSYRIATLSGEVHDFMSKYFPQRRLCIVNYNEITPGTPA